MRNCQPGAYYAGAGRRVAEADLRHISVSDHPTTDIRETCTVPSSCYPAPVAGRFGARNSHYRLCAASTTSAAMRRAIETPRDTDQRGQTTWLMGGASFCTRHKSYTRLRIGSAAPTEVRFMSDRRRSSMTRGGDRYPARFATNEVLLGRKRRAPCDTVKWLLQQTEIDTVNVLLLHKELLLLF